MYIYSESSNDYDTVLIELELTENDKEAIRKAAEATQSVGNGYFMEISANVEGYSRDDNNWGDLSELPGWDERSMCLISPEQLELENPLRTLSNSLRVYKDGAVWPVIYPKHGDGEFEGQMLDREITGVEFLAA